MSVRRSTGAPIPHFLSALDLDGRPHSVIIAGTRQQRMSLNGLSTHEITERMWYELIELASRVAQPRLTHGNLDDAASSLATVAVSAANFLHNLAFSDDFEEKEMIRLAARRKNVWPVLLSLGVRHAKGRKRSTTLGGAADKAKEYLSAIELGQQPEQVNLHLGDPRVGVFRKVAELLLVSLRGLRNRAWGLNQPTPWSKRLALLAYPMTTGNVDEWWRVAKEWMDEAWQDNPKLFEPLVRACSAKGKPLTKAGLFGSEVKSRVIDLRLKEAFCDLARPAHS